MSFTADNRFLVTGANDGEIYVWCGTEHKALRSLHIHKTAITNIVSVPRPLNLYGLNANAETVERLEIPYFQKYRPEDAIEV